MAWIESHQELRNHPKTKRLARKLGIPPAAATGYLHFLWWWAIDYAPDGDLTEFDDWEIADAAGWEGDDPESFKDALIFSGFLDNNKQGALTIHDWIDHAGRTLDQREKARQRTKKYREKQNETSTKHTPEANRTHTQAECDGDVTHTVRIQNANETESVTAGYASTEQNITEHDSTVQDMTIQNIPPTAPQGAGGETAGQEKPPDLQQKRFAEFWSEYPKKKSKGDAEKAWKKIKPTAELHEKIMTAVRDNKARNPDWQRDGGQYIPYPATWLNRKCWEDVIEPRATRTGGERNAGGNTRADPGATDFTGFQRSTGFRRADTETAAGC